jgi:hypothetical protein
MHSRLFQNLKFKLDPVDMHKDIHNIIGAVKINQTLLKLHTNDVSIEYRNARNKIDRHFNIKDICAKEDSKHHKN